MDYQRFISQLMELYHNWGQSSVTPKSEQFQAVLDKVAGMTTANVMQLLNLAVECMETDEVYCEIGCLQGLTLIGALLNHPQHMAYAVDNLADIDDSSEKFEQLSNNLAEFDLEHQVIFCAQEFEEFFCDLREINPQKIGVYYYAGAKDYRAQLLGLLLVRSFLADKALIIVSESNYSSVQQACWDFMAANPECKLLLDLPTPKDYHWTWGNGLQVFRWDVHQPADYNWSSFEKNFRHRPLIKYLSKLALEFDINKKREVVKVLEKSAIALEESHNFVEAEQKYKEILEWDRTYANVYHNLGILYYKMSRYQDALSMLLKSLSIDDSRYLDHYSLGLVLEKLGDVSQAMRAYENAIALNPQFTDAYNNLGNILYKTGKIEQAASIYRQAIAANPNHFGAYLNLGNILWKEHKVDQAYSAYDTALKLKPGDSAILNNLITVLADSGRTDEAIELATSAALLLPNEIVFEVRKNLMLPIVYDEPQQIRWYRKRFSEGLREITQQTSLATDEDINNALVSIGYATNFYLAYQGYNDLDLQKQYGKLVHQIMAAKYPQWVQPLPVPPLSQDGKIRVGYVSGYMHTHTVGRLMLGWIRHSNKQNFEVYCYYIGCKPDVITQQYREYSNAFHHIPENLEAVCQQIVSDKLHVLVFTDIGMLAQITQMAGLRLAPVQCVTWGHPVTSGSPTIDYYLSSDLMEPENAEEHYSEKLIRLPNIGICYAKPQISSALKSRADFNLPDDAVVYLSCQSLFKYLPQYDYIFTAIASQVPKAKFVFISNPKSHITELFRRRIQGAFTKVGLNSEEHCEIVPGQSWSSYCNLNKVSDIFLDTLSWSGGNTTLEAIACNLPVVTCPGEFMRGRHSYGILKMLGVTETIASSEAEYIEIAVKLGLDKEWRQSIVEKIRQNHDRLYDDFTCVEALEEFYRRVVREVQ